MNPLARKILLTAGSGIVAYLASNWVPLSLAFQAATSIFVGGVIFMVAYLVDVDQRLTKVEERVDKRLAHVEERQRQHALDTELLIKQGFTKNVLNQLTGSSEMDSNVPRLAFGFAQAEIARLSELLRDLSHGGDAYYEGEDRDWMLGLTRNTKTSIDAISLTTVDAGTDGGLWMADLGQRYLQLQQEAVKRGVMIRRIFVTDKTDLLAKKEFLDVCAMHRRMGIQVKVLDAADAPGTRANTMFDFIVFDGELSYESTPASVVTNRTRQPIIINTRLVQQKDRVDDRIARFEELWSCARDYED